jgi:hypothetical protein
VPWHEAHEIRSDWCVACSPLEGGVRWHVVQEPGGGVVPPPVLPPQLSVPWQEFEQDRRVALQPVEVATFFVPFWCVAAFTVVLEYPLPWQFAQLREPWVACAPVAGGTPWQVVHEVVGGVVPPPVPPQLSLPWQEFEQLRRDAFQPEVDARLTAPFWWVAVFTVVAE